MAFFYAVVFIVLGSAQLWATTDFENLINSISEGPNGPQCSEEVKGNCPEFLSEYYQTREELWKAPVSAFGESELVKSLKMKLHEIGNRCLHKMFLNCHPNLKEQIDPAELSNVYQELKQSSDYRMKSPEVFCFIRAKKLSRYFAEKGFKTEMIHIQKSPTLIAPLLDAKDNYRDQFIDYHGYHYVLSIKGTDGTEYILDPQFAEKPLSKKDYFVKTTGSECVNSQKQSLWGCNYSQYPSSWEAYGGMEFRAAESKFQNDRNGDRVEKYLKGEVEFGKCGHIETSKSYFSPENRPEDSVKENKITDRKRAELIVASHQKLYLELVKSSKDVGDFEGHIKTVCEDLGLPQKDCEHIRQNFDQYLK